MTGKADKFTATIQVILLNGTTADANEVMDNFYEIYANIDNSNVAAAAGVVFSKLDSATVAGVSAVQTLTNKTLTAPVINGSVTTTGLTLPAFTLGGTVTLNGQSLSGSVIGTYTLGGTPTISSPILSGTVTGTYTIAGTPTFSGTIAGAPTLSGAWLFNAGAAVATNQRLWLDGGDNDFLTSPSNGIIDAYVAGSQAMRISTTLVQAIARGISVATNQGIYLDGGTNDYFISTGDGIIDTYVAGVQALRVANVVQVLGRDLYITSGNYVDLSTGGGTESIRRSSAGNVTITAGSATSANFKSEGVLLPAADPPTANYANRNGIVKGWTGMSSTGVIFTDNYNVSSTTRLSDPGVYQITWDTDFGGTNYTATAMTYVTSTFASNTAQAAGTLEYRVHDDAGNLTNAATAVIAIGAQ